MAHFFRPPSGERVSQKTVNLNLGGALSLGLWGPCESTGRYLDIKIDNPSIARFGDYAAIQALWAEHRHYARQRRCQLRGNLGLDRCQRAGGPAGSANTG